MKILSFLFCLGFCWSLPAQNSLWHKAAFLNKSMEDKPLSDSKRKEYRQFLQENFDILDTCVSPKRLLIMNHKIASILYVLDAPKDSVELFLNRTVAAAPDRACRMMMRFEAQRGNKETANKFLRRTYFAREFSEEWWKNFVQICEETQPKLLAQKEKEIPKEIINNLAYAQALELMQVKDQAHRIELSENNDNPILWKKQRKLDVQNRVDLDSLYQKFGFPNPTEVGKKGFLTAWYILQHSPDCEWNQKWIILFIEEYKKNKIFQALIPQTINRFFHPTRGFCSEEIRKAFILQLTEQYSSDIAKRFGYLDFIENRN